MSAYDPPSPPFYYSPHQRLLVRLPDHLLTLAVPVIAYWSLSLVFHVFDLSGWKWLDKYKLHESEELRKRNLVQRSEVVFAVIFQQIIQTLMGFLWLQEEVDTTNAARAALVIKGLQRWQSILEVLAHQFHFHFETAKAAWFMYWWAVPLFQFLFAMFIIDTWQYFLHRAMHVNQFLYKSFHSWHHRLYVPYAFGSLYNHPVEGFLLDTMGAGLAEWMTGMTTRQAMVLFLVSVCKTVDDHCGYSLPWDPLQMFFGNNADYHDIHHQVIGIKSNFSQPFFVHWDILLGTRMTREELQRRKKKKQNGDKME